LPIVLTTQWGVYIIFWGVGVGVGGNLCDGKPKITQIRLQLSG
jgi:hypothetical protein